MLGLGLGALQLMLDRGEFKDWFGSTEIIVYAVLCRLGFYLFLVHMFTAKAPLIPPRIFRDMNFSAGLAIIFAVGMLVLATAALLHPICRFSPAVQWLKPVCSWRPAVWATWFLSLLLDACPIGLIRG